MHRKCMLLSLSWITYYLSLVLPASADRDPIGVPWSANTFGYDGPWPAVEISVGLTQKISMFPGSEWATIVIPTDYCSYNTSMACQASSAGLYKKGTYGGGIAITSGPGYMKGLPVKGKDMDYWMADVDLLDGSGIITPNVSMKLVGENFASYPNGNWYPLSAGCLGLGAPDTKNQTFGYGENSLRSAINASLIPGNLYERGKIESNSFGMHIGSANPRMAGSLYFGGYDQNRVVGEVLTSTDDYNKEIPLKDIAIKVVDGSSPWSFGTTQEGLLAQGNSSIGPKGVQVHVDGCSPYLSLPRSTCDAIAQHLPVAYSEDLGLYTWKTDDPKYSQIVGSASALVFTFLGSTNTDKVSISVPFRHLNLTLDRPLVDSPSPYFPCFTGSSSYVLGRAFLQDAFVGANWGSRTWFLAQAPGPNVPPANVVKFESSEAQLIKPSQNDWRESWAGSWKALTPAEAGSNATIVPPDDHAPSSSNSPENSVGLSTGAKAGIGVGAGVGALALIGALIFFWSRHSKEEKEKRDTDGSNFHNNNKNHPIHGGDNGIIGGGGGAPPGHQAYYEPAKEPGALRTTMDGSGYHPPSSTHNSTLYSGSDAHYSSTNSQHTSNGYDTYQAHPQPYSAELPGTYIARPLELPAPATTHTQPGSLPPPHSSGV
ncbi:hypothetical protein PG994_014352 [Apiospora phragmitis]|uniref:Peptidase A1 domain-containing protein n=1 Tax=Apiospora phragmitis TaxID=2905665 RepID=A0ABR1T5U4_9PEZI